MFLIFSLISYLIFQDDPPVIFAYSLAEGVDFSGSLVKAAEGKNVYIYRPSNANVTVRVSQLEQFKSSCSIELDKIYVYQNSTDLQTIYNSNSTSGKIIEELVSAANISGMCNDIKNHASEGIVLVTDHYPEFKKVGYSNPFTPGVWNCFFFILFTLSFVIWSMIHYANIDVQTRFAKKLY